MKKLIPLILLITACSGCHSFTDPVYRTSNDQMKATLKINTYCRVPDPNADAVMVLLGIDTYKYEISSFGTGVAVSSNRVLTARHVVTCDDSGPSKVTVSGTDETEKDVEIEVILPKSDVVRLRLVNDGDKLEYTPVVIGSHPAAGEQVCMAAAVPHWGYHCGLVQPDSTDNSGYIEWDWFTEFGNSGSAVYHNGQLIGLLDALTYCQGGVQCRGFIMPIQDYKWLIPSE